MGTMTKAVWGGLGTLSIFLFLATLVTDRRDWSRAEMTVAEVLEKLATAANAMEGQEVGPNVIVNRASVENGRRLTYFYTIPMVVSGKDERALAEKLAEEVRYMACADPAQRRAVEGGAEIRYAYRQRDGSTIVSVDIDRRVCAEVSQG